MNGRQWRKFKACNKILISTLSFSLDGTLHTMSRPHSLTWRWERKEFQTTSIGICSNILSFPCFHEFENNESWPSEYISITPCNILLMGIQYQALPLLVGFQPKRLFPDNDSCAITKCWFVCRSSSPNYAIHYRRFFHFIHATCRWPGRLMYGVDWVFCLSSYSSS